MNQNSAAELNRVDCDRGFAFPNLFSPVSEDVFFSDYWEKRQLIVSRTQPDYFKSLSSLADVDLLIALSKPYPNEQTIRLVKSVDGNLVSKGYPLLDDGSADIHVIYNSFHDGFTLILNRLHSRWDPIARLAANVEWHLRHRIGVNMYISPANSQAFPPHTDNHDVFILQLSGHKDWRLYDSPVELPLEETEVEIADELLANPRAKVRLMSGDTIYIPRGMAHEALTSDETSVHLTVGIYPVRWVDLLQEALKTAADHEVAYRKALPAGYLDPGNEAEIAEQLEQLVAHFCQNRAPLQTIASFRKKHIEKLKPLADGHFASLDGINRLTSETRLAHRIGMTCQVVRENGKAVIRFPGNCLRGPLKIEAALKFIAATDEFTVGELPDDLSPASKIVLCKRLIREGLLRILDQGEN